MFNSKIASYFFLFVLLISCTRDDLDVSEDILDPLPTPEIIIEEPEEVPVGVSFKVDGINAEQTNPFGFGLIEPLNVGAFAYFAEVVVRADNTAQVDPFLLGWFMEDLTPGERLGEIAVLGIKDDMGSFDFISSGIGTSHSFTVDIKTLGPLGTFMSGGFEGTGIRQSTGVEESFSGTFMVPRGICTNYLEINEEEFNRESGDAINIIDARILEDCIYIATEPLRACALDEVILFDSGAILESAPPQRNIRIKNQDLIGCPDLLLEAFAYDLRPLQIDGWDEIILNLDGWDTPLIYKY